MSVDSSITYSSKLSACDASHIAGDDPATRLMAAILLSAVSDCRCAIRGKGGKQATLNAASAVAFLLSPQGRSLSALLTGRKGKLASVALARLTADSIGIPVHVLTQNSNPDWQTAIEAGRWPTSVQAFIPAKAA